LAVGYHNSSFKIPKYIYNLIHFRNFYLCSFVYFSVRQIWRLQKLFLRKQEAHIWVLYIRKKFCTQFWTIYTTYNCFWIRHYLVYFKFVRCYLHIYVLSLIHLWSAVLVVLQSSGRTDVQTLSYLILQHHILLLMYLDWK
jgi:hypothetical protein